MSGVRPALLGACVFLAAVTVLSARAQVQATALDEKATTSNLHPVLIELFTSEGCSSCPPADILVKKLDEFQPIQGAELIVLSEHVTYWDHDGWKDPNSSTAFTERQSSYEGGLGEKEVFTPQLIVDGMHELRMDQVPAWEAVLIKAKEDLTIPVRISEATFDPGNPAQLRAKVETDINSGKHGAEVYLAVALDHVESQVLRGENGGKHLEHVAVVQQLVKVGKLSKGKNFSQDVQVKLKPGEDPKNLRLIAFVQESGPGRVLGATLDKSIN